MSKKINGFKGFKKDMTCRGFQYEEGKTYTMDDEPECCEKGFHFCEYPLDCLNYYDATESVYHEVESTGKIDKGNNGDDTKISTNEIKIGARLSWRDIAEASIEFVMKHAKKGGKGANKRTDYSVSSNTGNYSVSSNTGNYSVSSNTGNYSVSSNTGYKSVSSNTGKNGIASNLGIYGRASGKIGTWLVLAEWIEEEYEYKLKEVKTIEVDGKKIKEDTLYRLIGGKFVEVSE